MATTLPSNVGGNNNNEGGLTERDYLAIGICSGFLVMLYIFAMIVFIVIKRKQRKDRRLREQFLQLPVPEGIGFKSSRSVNKDLYSQMLARCTMKYIFRILGLDEQYLTDLARYQCRAGQCHTGVRTPNDDCHPSQGWGLSTRWRNGKRSLKQAS